jgi:hypothetical protein
MHDYKEKHFSADNKINYSIEKHVNLKSMKVIRCGGPVPNRTIES